MTTEHIFISYAHHDRAFVDTLAARLEAAAVAIWYDRDLTPGRPWSAELEARLREAHAVIVVLSPASAGSEYVRKEIHFAQEADKRFVPVLLHATEVPLPLADLQWVDAQEGRDPLPDLLTALRGEATPPDVPPIPSNPFVPLAGLVDDPQLFFDREREIQEVFELLNSGASVALIGESSVGKSSLVQAICHQAESCLRESRRSIYLNLESVENEEDFYSALCTEIGIPSYKGSLLVRALKDHRLLLALDELEKMTWDGFTWGVRSQLRGLAQRGTTPPLRLVVAARTPLDRLFHDSENMTSPLQNICYPVTVKPWDEDTAYAFVHDRLSGTPINFSGEEIARLVHESQGYPQRLMRLCNRAYREHVRRMS